MRKIIFLIFCFLLIYSFMNAAPKIKNNTVTTDNSIEREIRIRYGMTLDRLLRAELGTGVDTHDILTAFKGVFNPRHIKAGEHIYIKLFEDGVLAELLYKPKPEFTISVFPDTAGHYSAKIDTLPTITKSKLLVGELKTSLYEAILEQGESPELIMAFSDIFQWDIDFFIDPRAGDQFAILFEKNFIYDPATSRMTFTSYGPIQAAAYAKTDTTLLAFSFRDSSGYLKYYDENGNSFQKTFLKSPLNYRRISSYFSRGRFHPILKRVRAHTGVDFAARAGTPVVAAADGVITLKKWHGGYGRCIKISHKNGSYTTLYGHLSRYAGGLKVGQRVQQNQLIGYVGSSGLATGPHLHYTMYHKGRAINPLKIKPLSGDPIAKNLRDGFNQHKAALTQKLGLDENKQFNSMLENQEISAR